MCLIYAGFIAFPLGAYTVAERNALDAADDRPDNSGATFDGAVLASGWLDKQVLNRYGVKMHALPDDSEATLRKFLTTPGYALVVQGTVGNWPVGHPLRRWEPEFNGNHAICIITGPQPRVLDPLAPLHFVGDLTDVDTVLLFAWTGSKYSRYMKQNELAAIPDTDTQEPDVKTTIIISQYPQPWPSVVLAKGRSFALYDADQLAGPVKRISTPADHGTRALCDATVQIARDPASAPMGTFRRIGNGPDKGLLLLKDDVTLESPAPVDDCATKVADAKNQAIAAANAQWESWVAQRPKGS